MIENTIELSEFTTTALRPLLEHLYQVGFTIVKFTVINGEVNDTDYEYGHIQMVIHHFAYKGKEFHEVLVIVDNFGFISKSGDIS